MHAGPDCCPPATVKLVRLARMAGAAVDAQVPTSSQAQVLATSLGKVAFLVVWSWPGPPVGLNQLAQQAALEDASDSACCKGALHLSQSARRTKIPGCCLKRPCLIFEAVGPFRAAGHARTPRVLSVLLSMRAACTTIAPETASTLQL